MSKVSATRTCTRCGEDQPPSSLYADRSKPSGLKPACKACMDEARRSRVAADPANYAEIQRRYVEAHPNDARVNTARYRASNIDAVRNRRQEYRARSRGSTVATVDRAAIIARDASTCHLCGLPADQALAWPDPMSLTLDHLLPLSAGGAHDPANLPVAHLVCYQRNGHRHA